MKKGTEEQEEEVIPMATVVNGDLPQSIVTLNDPNLRGLVVVPEVMTKGACVPLHPSAYKVSALPQNVSVKQRPTDSLGWDPQMLELRQLEPLLFVQEQPTSLFDMASCFFRGQTLGSLKLHFYVNDKREVYVIDKKMNMLQQRCCRLSLAMNLSRTYTELEQAESQSVLIGRVREEFEVPFNQACKCCAFNFSIEKATHDVNGKAQFEPQFILSANMCCSPGGDCGNWCGKNMVFGIYDLNGNEVGHVQKTFAGNSCCRSKMNWDNYILEFPPEVTTADDRMLILTSIFRLDHTIAQENDNNDGD